jgi:hypothetical protein
LSKKKTKDPILQVFHGASRARTGDLLGAIQVRGLATQSRLLVAFHEPSG